MRELRLLEFRAEASMRIDAECGEQVQYIKAPAANDPPSKLAGNTELFRAGDRVTYLYLAISGDVRLTGMSSPITAGHLVGELGSLSPTRCHPFGAVCEGEFIVKRISPETFWRLIEQYQTYAQFLLKNIASRQYDVGFTRPSCQG